MEEREGLKKGVKALGLDFYVKEGTTIARRRVWRRDAKSPAQLAQRERWTEADCLWRSMWESQRKRWVGYYFKGRERGVTKQERIEKVWKDWGASAERDMSSYGYFMKKAMRWDLREWLLLHMQVDWVVEGAWVMGNELIITARLEHPAWAWRAFQPPERSYIRGR